MGGDDSDSDTDSNTHTDSGAAADGLDELLETVVALKERGEYDRAIGLLDQMLDREGDAVARSGEIALRGEVKAAAGRLAAAVADYDRAIELTPETSEFYYRRGLLQVERGNRTAAVEDCSAAVQRAPEAVGPRQVRAELRLLLGAPARALEDARTALELSETPGDRAVSLLLIVCAGTALGTAVDDAVADYRALCADDVDADWDVTHLDAWLADADLSETDRATLRELIDRLR